MKQRLTPLIISITLIHAHFYNYIHEVGYNLTRTGVVQTIPGMQREQAQNIAFTLWLLSVNGYTLYHLIDPINLGMDFQASIGSHGTGCNHATSTLGHCRSRSTKEVKCRLAKLCVFHIDTHLVKWANDFTNAKVPVLITAVSKPSISTCIHVELYVYACFSWISVHISDWRLCMGTDIRD